MKRLLSAAALAAVASFAFGSVQAATTSPTVTRAEVVSQLHHAEAEGLVPLLEADPYPVVPTDTEHEATRAEVVAQMNQARKDGTLFLQEDDVYPPVKAERHQESRADVVASLARYQAAHPDQFIAH